jgi:general secretion pathway protein B
MSYILDALKKSDQDRKQGEVPGINSFQSQPRPPRSTSRIMFYILIGALLINALVLGIWALSRQPEIVVATADLPETVTGKTDAPLPEDVEATWSAEIITETAPTTTAPVPAEATTTPPEPEAAEIDTIPITETESETDISADEDEAPKKLIKYRNLPANVRNDLKDINISVHYYANEPASRMASVNGRIMRQGQSVKDGLVLDEITRKGVIFTFRKYRFSMDVFKH